MNNAFDLWQNSHQDRINKFLKKKLHNSNTQNTIHEATTYALLNGGKRFRALLIYAIGEINATDKTNLDFIAASIEIIHAYSLTHDDLPDMDDDPLRRGLPSCHIKYGASQAILAGDGLQSLAFEFLVSKSLCIDDAKKIDLITFLSKAIGINGMVYGQYLDIQNESNKDVDKDMLDQIHNLKTGKLIECSVMLGQIGSDIKISLFKEFASHIGLAFQITDDILDVTQTEEVLGKNKNSDIKNNKITYIDVLGLDGAKEKAKELTDLSLETLDRIDVSGKDKLKNIAKYLISRQN